MSTPTGVFQEFDVVELTENVSDCLESANSGEQGTIVDGPHTSIEGEVAWLVEFSKPSRLPFVRERQMKLVSRHT